MIQSDRLTLAGVIGHPVAHSKSPAIHEYWLKKYKINGYYVPLEVSEANFGEVLQTLPKMGYRGVNVTVPHKETAVRHTDRISDQAALIGAVNTLTFHPDGKVYGDNTDSYGFLQNLKLGIPRWRASSGPALVFGAGGAARAVVFALLSEGTPEIIIVNRTRERADILKSEFGNRVMVADVDDLGKILGKMNTLVNTTVLGMHGKPDLKIPAEMLRPDCAVSDIVYTPLNTRFLKDCENQGCQVVNGLGMLLHQAAASFDFWFQIMPEVDRQVQVLALSP